MTKTEQASKAGKASVIARQTPQLIADKAQAIALHQAGKDTGEIGRTLSRERTEIRRWLIAAGIYRTAGRGKWHKGRKLQRRYDAIRLILAQYESEFRQIAKTDESKHWRNHPATRRKAYNGCTDAMRARSRAYAKANYPRNKLKFILSNRIKPHSKMA